jgi:F0F1-type ATP synthase assembly protein I
LRIFSQAFSFAVCTYEGAGGNVAEQPQRKPASGSGQPGVEAYLGYGLTLAASTLLFLWLGTKADSWLGTEPWLALLGAFVGAGAGFYHMVHHLIVAPRAERDRQEEE